MITIKWTPLPRPHFHLLFRFSVVVKSVSHIHWYYEMSVITEPLFIHFIFVSLVFDIASGFLASELFADHLICSCCFWPELLPYRFGSIAFASIRLSWHQGYKSKKSPKLNFKTPPSCLFSLMSDTSVKFSCKEVQDQTSALGSKQLDQQTVATSSQWHTAGNVYPQSAGK